MILGGGFVGLFAALHLHHQRYSGQEILKGDPEQLRKVAEVALQHRAIPVELCLESEVKSVRAGEVELLRHDRVETLTAGTIIWTTGTTPHPLIKTLPIPNEHRDRAARLHVTLTIEMLPTPARNFKATAEWLSDAVFDRITGT